MEKWNHEQIDEVSTLEMLQMFNEQDKKVALAVEQCLPEIAKAVDLIAKALEQGGRLIYIGSGTSGKLSVMDASECPPTFGVEDDLVRGIISGGLDALVGWKEETEDDESLSILDLKKINLCSKDVLVGVSASGNTPYVLSALRYAADLGCSTVGLYCAPGGLIEKNCNIAILADVGPEVILGSSRLKAGTAQKMILNMLSSGSMIKLGKTYGNLMVDVRPINKKLQKRVLGIISHIAGCSEKEAEEILLKAEGSTKTAILMQRLNMSKEKADDLLAQTGGRLKKAMAMNGGK